MQAIAWARRPLLRPPEKAENTTIMTSSEGGLGILMPQESASSIANAVPPASSGPTSNVRAACQASARDLGEDRYPIAERDSTLGGRVAVDEPDPCQTSWAPRGLEPMTYEISTTPEGIARLAIRGELDAVTV